MADLTSVAKQFTDYYYTQFDIDRSQLAPLYRDKSMLTFEGEQFQGTGAIIEKLRGLSFGTVQHKVTTLDVQPSSPTQTSLLVSVTGLLLVDDNVNPLNYSQVFQLIAEDGTYYVYNDIFRLNLG
ncbi:hypothetical protein HYDPIDRAFT_106304 [Hydnomerulius pinastri MD-312]|nr:hypothetical protein HYDPIDRAFT_106304 [Hydnomerulius pinastri MD-312]